ncbi:ficolin-1-B-like, partial [Drosophila mojavensis]|uniref:ficolin-1-B-like n=1 Tax=Drosophila mojavensis TaxID=7230 RepID=UPI001CD134B0
NGQSVKTASYSNFRIGNETEGYAIQSLGEYSGDAGDGLRESLYQKFSTLDRDNDLLLDVKCSKDASGGWWQTNCGNSSNMVYWNAVLDSIYSVELLIRPTNMDGN